MELSRGICALCTTNTKIVNPTQAEYITCLILDILEDHIDATKFSGLGSIKLCPICLYDILTLSKLKRNIQGHVSVNQDQCSLCWTSEHVVSVKDWAYFDTLLINLANFKKQTRCSICIGCINYLHLLQKVKTNFLKKFPHVELSHRVKNKKKKLGHEKKEALPVSKKLKRTLRHLKPLNKSNFNVENFKDDDRLYTQVAFVRLEASPGHSTNEILHSLKKHHDKVVPKPSFFKIKLKASKKVTTTGKLTKTNMKTYQIVPGNYQKELFVKLPKMNFSVAEDCNGHTQYSTLTKASRKTLPDDSTILGSETQKRVSFSDIVTVEIKEEKKHNVNGSPLKSLLKKSKTQLDSNIQTNNPTNSDASNDSPRETTEENAIDSVIFSNECDSNANGEIKDSEVVVNLNKKLMSAIVDSCGNENQEATTSRSPDSSNNDTESPKLNSESNNGHIDHILRDVTGDQSPTSEDNHVSSTISDRISLKSTEDDSPNQTQTVSSPLDSPDTSSLPVNLEETENINKIENADVNVADDVEAVSPEPDISMDDTNVDTGTKLGKRLIDDTESDASDSKRIKLSPDCSTTSDDDIDDNVTESTLNFSDTQNETDAQESPVTEPNQDENDSNIANFVTNITVDDKDVTSDEVGSNDGEEGKIENSGNSTEMNKSPEMDQGTDVQTEKKVDRDSTFEEVITSQDRTNLEAEGSGDFETCSEFESFELAMSEIASDLKSDESETNDSETLETSDATVIENTQNSSLESKSEPVETTLVVNGIENTLVDKISENIDANMQGNLTSTSPIVGNPENQCDAEDDLRNIEEFLSNSNIEKTPAKSENKLDSNETAV